VLCESGFGDKYGEVVALRARLSRLPPCLGKMILLRKIIPGGRTGLTRLENIPKNRQLATIVIIANALVNADLSGDQAWFSIAPGRADKAAVSGSSPLRPTLGK
jgi:hypothetical protein